VANLCSGEEGARTASSNSMILAEANTEKDDRFPMVRTCCICDAYTRPLQWFILVVIHHGGDECLWTSHHDMIPEQTNRSHARIVDSSRDLTVQRRLPFRREVNRPSRASRKYRSLERKIAPPYCCQESGNFWRPRTVCADLYGE
jgi:hypothetical protein